MAKLPQQKAPKGSSTSSRPSSVITDPRFASISTDPRYRLPSKKHTHVKLDKRFARMLRDDEFSRKATVDRYGRKLPKGSGRKDLERFYRMEEDEEGSNEADKEEDVRAELKRVANYDPARQGGFESSSEESSEEEDEEELGLDAAEEAAKLIGEDVEEIPMGEISSRIAIVNLDWDNIRAVDLMAAAQSFAPPDGRILKVSIYPSEFGKERMEREELEGPPQELFKPAKRHAGERAAISPNEDSSEDDDDDDARIKKQLQAEDQGEEFDSSHLRAYQLSRLRYYYAVLTCSSPSTAHALYTAMDGREYLTTANFFDMRFIPDSTSFDDDRPRDECEKVPEGYRPNEFVTDALTHSKVRLTWDADDQTRKEVQKRAFSRGEIEDNDLLAYIGSDTSSDEDEAATAPSAANGTSSGENPKMSEKEAQRQRLRVALGLSAEPLPSSQSKKNNAPVGDLQVTFTPALSSAAKRSSVFENEPIKEDTTVEKYIRKEKERKAKRKAKAKGAVEGTDAGSTEQPNPALDQELKGKPKLASKSDNAPAEVKTHGNGAHQGKTKVEDEQEEQQEKDPFNDPFFIEGPTASNTHSRTLARAQKRADRLAAAAASAAQRAELELLMADDAQQAGSSGVRHFDMKEIMKKEKEARRKAGREKKKKDADGGAGRGGEGNAENGGGKDGEAFKVDVRDPRFAKVFESHDFAIDPTNPRFRGTEGMRAMLEEGRRRRGKRKDRGEEEDADGDGVSKKTKVDGDALARAEGGDDLQTLVARVKGKTAKVR